MARRRCSPRPSPTWKVPCQAVLAGQSQTWLPTWAGHGAGLPPLCRQASGLTARRSRRAFAAPSSSAWAEKQVRQLIEGLEAADPDSNCWTFGLPRSRLFWFRRQALETAVHAWDAQRSVGHPDAIDAKLACDGVDEFLAVMLPRQIQQHPDGWTGQSLHLHRTDGDGEWMVRLGPGTAVSSERAHAKGDVALRGPASSIYLWCVGRLPSSDLEVLGDRNVADRWTSEVAF